MRVLWIPMFSMRSRETGNFNILKDGNFQLAFSRMLASNYQEIIMAVPHRTDDFHRHLENPLTTILNKAKEKFDKNFSVIQLQYGNTPRDTREKFWDLNKETFIRYIACADIDLVVTDITGFPYDFKFINNFNVTKIKELDRPYVDEFFEKDIDSIRKAELTTVINPVQKEYIVSQYPELEDKVRVNTKVVNELFYELIDINTDECSEIPKFNFSKTIFWPFRLTDKDYKFDEFIEVFEKNNMNLKYQILITDPNDAYTGDKDYIKKFKPTKSQYYEILKHTPVIPMLDDIDLVLHPGTCELFYFTCRVITFENSLIPHNLTISSLDEICDKIDEAFSYDTKASEMTGNIVDTGSFLYLADEISKVYHE